MLIIQRPEVEAGEPDGNTQQFTISPLEPGFGHTLGNSLRRTLLSSIPGAAVTQVRFDEALHEFDVDPRREGRRHRPHPQHQGPRAARVRSDEPVTLRLDKRGPGEVTAGDIQTTADVEILNPELHLATVNAKGRLAVDLTVEQGRGYLSAERNKRTATIGVIPVDAIFSPGAAGRVLGRADPGRAGDQLRQAHARDRDRRFDLAARRPGVGGRRRCATSWRWSPSSPTSPAGLELGEVSPTTATSPDLELPIEELDLSERPRNCLKRARVDTIGQLVQKTEDDLLAITNFGSKSLEEVLQKLDERGLSLRVKE